MRVCACVGLFLLVVLVVLLVMLLNLVPFCEPPCVPIIVIKIYGGHLSVLHITILFIFHTQSQITILKK